MTLLFVGPHARTQLGSAITQIRAAAPSLYEGLIKRTEDREVMIRIFDEKVRQTRLTPAQKDIATRYGHELILDRSTRPHGITDDLAASVVTTLAQITRHRHPIAYALHRAA